MVKSQLRVYTRLKPVTQEENQVPHRIFSNNSLQIQFTRSNRSSPCHDRHQFTFDRILGTDTKQNEVFDIVSKPVVLSCLNGYNGTVFAYGQTGSGKTYTMSGSDKWENRGIIPRVLSLIFREFQARKEDVEYHAYISYMQIYNENAYDLLDKKRNLDVGIENWNKIQLYEDQDGNFNLKGISVHQCKHQTEGIQLMMAGNYIRQISSTPMNQCSSRSHCVFTINIEGKELKSDIRFTAKLHLVDLAGSQRTSKTKVEGNLLHEAKHINLSLTYLEQVIVALNERRNTGSRTHIPYRNSLMTTILKDSLGGNCQTVMISTLSLDILNIEETVSTLRFSQRVGMLENEVQKNQKVVRVKQIDSLTRQNQLLKAKLNHQQVLLNGLSATSLTDELALRKVSDWLNQAGPDLPVSSAQEGKMYLRAVKKLYSDRTREFVSELTKIQEQLQRYDEQIKRQGWKQTMSEQGEKNSSMR